MALSVLISKLKINIYQPENKRLFILFGIFLVIVGYVKRPWFYTLTLESENYVAYSTANKEQTSHLMKIAEIVYQTYSGIFPELCIKSKSHPKLKLKIYQNRKEFKTHNLFCRWAEALYKKPYCQQYYDRDSQNPYHWMIHEATHQLNNEIAGVRLQKWLEEGIACYFGTSTIENNRLKLGSVDQSTYPIWWLSDIQLNGDMQTDIKSGRFIPLKCIISN